MTRLHSLAFICSLVMIFPLLSYSQDAPPASFVQLVDVSNYKGSVFTAECWFYADKVDPKKS